MTNVSVLVGNLTKDPELRFSPNGVAVCSFTVAVTRSFANQNGERESDFIQCKAFKKQAENLANFMKKGSKVSVTGRIQTGSYEGQDGKRIYTTDVIADNIQFLDKKESDQQGGQQTQQQYNPGQQQQQQPLNQPMYGGNPNQPQGQFHTGGQAPQQSYQWSQQQQQQQQQQPNYTRVDEDPFANSKGPIEIKEDDLPF